MQLSRRDFNVLLIFQEFEPQSVMIDGDAYSKRTCRKIKNLP